MAFFADLEPEDRERLLQLSRLKSFERGEILFRAGDPSDFFHILVAGRVKISSTQRSGKDVILAILGPGDPVGVVAVYRGIPFPANAEAIEDGEVLSFPKAEFFSLLERRPSFVRGLLQGMTTRLVELTGRLSSVIGSRVEPRFARLFLRLAEDTGEETEAGTLIRLRLSRQELADLTGTTIETCIRIMSRWGKDDVVLTKEEGFLVRDIQALLKISES